MTITRYDKILYTWKKLKKKMMKENKRRETKSPKLENKKKGYESSLCKERRLKPFRR